MFARSGHGDRQHEPHDTDGDLLPLVQSVPVHSDPFDRELNNPSVAGDGFRHKTADRCDRRRNLARRFLLGTGIMVGTAGFAGCGIPGGGGGEEGEEGEGGEEEDEEEQLQAPEST